MLIQNICVPSGSPLATFTRQTFIYFVKEWGNVPVKLMRLDEITIEFSLAKQFSVLSMLLADNESS